MAAIGEPDEEKLLERAAQGDRSASNELLSRYRPRLRKMVAIRMDPRLKSRIDPFDVVQDALLDAARMLPDYIRDRPLPYYPWLRQLAWQRLYDLNVGHIHAQKRSVTREVDRGMSLSDDSVVELARRVASSGGGPSTILYRKELRSRVRDALERLKPDDRELLVLRYLEQLSSREIAAVVGISEPAVNVRHLRALKRMHELLKGVLGDT